MKTEKNSDLMEILRDKGIATDKETYGDERDEPWYTKVISAFSGWLASIFMMSFVFAFFGSALKNGLFTLGVGTAMIVAAGYSLRKMKNRFSEHLFLAISLAGQGLIIWGLYETFGFKWLSGTWQMWLIVALLEAILVYFVPNALHRFFSSTAGTVALLIAGEQLKITPLLYSISLFLFVKIWLGEFGSKRQWTDISPTGYGMGIALLAVESLWYENRVFSTPAESFLMNPWLNELVAATALLYLVWNILKREGISPLNDTSGRLSMVFAGIAGLLSLGIYGLAPALTVLLLGFAEGDRRLFAIGIVSMLIFFMLYYYNLHITLLYKAALLAASGAGLLCARYALRNFIFSEEEENQDA